MKNIKRFIKWIKEIKCKCYSSCCESKCSVNDNNKIDIETNDVKIKISPV